MKKDRQILIKDEYLRLIIDIGFDYDGYNTIDGLKGVINQLIDYAIKAAKNDDKSVIYSTINGEGLNILREKITDDSKM